MLEIHLIPLLSDNYAYVLRDHESHKTAVIDPSESSQIISFLEKKRWGLDYILNTHHHWDHVGGNEELKEKYKAQVIASHTEKNRIPGCDIGLEEAHIFELGHSKAVIIETPGHTIGAICFYFAEDHAVFTGDTLFSLGCGRMFEGTPAQMYNSLHRLADLPRKTKIYCGHEYTQKNGQFALRVDPKNDALQDYCHHVAYLRSEGIPTIPSTVEIEVEANPFLRAPLLREKLGIPNATNAEAFAALRAMKDKF